MRRRRQAWAYRKGDYEPLDESLFQSETIQRDGHTVLMEVAEGVFAEEGWPPLRLEETTDDDLPDRDALLDDPVTDFVDLDAYFAALG